MSLPCYPSVNATPVADSENATPGADSLNATPGALAVKATVTRPVAAVTHAALPPVPYTHHRRAPGSRVGVRSLAPVYDHVTVLILMDRSSALAPVTLYVTTSSFVPAVRKSAW